MCEINPKRSKFYRLEFFTSHPLTDAEWEELVVARLVGLEQAFNLEGRVRVHIHEIPDEPDVTIDCFDADGGEL